MAEDSPSSPDVVIALEDTSELVVIEVLPDAKAVVDIPDVELMIFVIDPVNV